MKNIFKHKTKAQSTLEFTFAMIVTMLIVYSMVQVFRWAGMDLANRRVSQDLSIVNLDSTGDPSSELNSDVGTSVLPMAAVYHGSITNGTSQ